MGQVLHFLGNLLVITPVFIAWLIAVTVAGWTGVGLLIRFGRRVAAVLAATVALVLTFSAAGDAVNAHYQFLPRVDDVIGLKSWPTASPAVLRRPVAQSTVLAAGTAAPPAHARGHVRTVDPSGHPRGAVLTLPLPGPVSGFGTHGALVYLPPQYFTQPERRFPVIYLVHGSPGAPIDWFRAAMAADAGLAAAEAGNPVLLVAPKASRYWTDDSECVNRPAEHIETYLTVDVPAAVDAALRTVPDRRGRALAGNSAGGFCALNLGLRHRDEFSAVLDLSGYDHPTFDGGMAGLFGPVPHLAQQVAAEDPSQYAAALAPAPRLALWLDTGTADGGARRDVERMARILSARGQDVVLRERPGGHEYGVWRPALHQSVLWAAGLLSAG